MASWQLLNPHRHEEIRFEQSPNPLCLLLLVLLALLSLSNPNQSPQGREGRSNPIDGRRRRHRRPVATNPVRDPEHGPRDAGAGLRHGLQPRAAGPGRHHPPRRPPRLPPHRHGLPLRHGAGRGGRRGRGRALGRRGLPRRPLRHLQALDLRRAPGTRRAGAPGVPRPPRPRLPRPLPRPLARRRRPLRRRGATAGGVRHGGRVAGHGGVPPARPRALRRRQQLLRRQDGPPDVPRRRAARRQPGRAQRRVEAGEGAGGVRAPRRRHLRQLAARRARHRVGLRRRHGERRPAPSRRRQRQDRRAGGAAVGVRAGCVLRGKELQQGEAGAEHGYLLRLGAERGEGDDRDDTTEEGVPWGVFRVARRALQVSQRTLGRRDVNLRQAMRPTTVFYSLYRQS